ncbi:S-adenosyl-L-methionine-dependent methyltransferase [Amylostereum chailletii]|nr:S-adenosyl-L-methionine-dependent methyltransferase [Amylostereum chailletii]
MLPFRSAVLRRACARRTTPAVRPSLSSVVSPRRRYVTHSSKQDPVTPVEKILLDSVKANGPISFATYMQLCLSHPTEGYYMNPENAIFGTHGDFITSPDISQVFGQLLGIWLLSQYMLSAQGQEIELVELGPGRGTLMDDVLRTLMQLPHSANVSKTVHLVETSQSVRRLQADLLSGWGQYGVSIQWHDSIDTVIQKNGAFTMLLAHEFFDALPFHLIEKTQQGWHEVLLTSAKDPAAKTVLRPSNISGPAKAHLDIDTTLTSSTGPRLRPVLSHSPSPISTLLGSSSPRFQAMPIGSRIEVSASGFQSARKIGEMIAGPGRNGCALIVDYGGDHVYGNSFRAFKDHKQVDPFHLPGKCDLTVNVDFAYLKEAMAGTAAVHGPLDQHTFLKRMGLDTRVKGLTEAAKDPVRKETIRNAAERLVDLTGMGKQYQVLGLTSTGAAAAGSLGLGVWPFYDFEQVKAGSEEAQKKKDGK